MNLGLLLDMAVENGPDEPAVTDTNGDTLSRVELRALARRAATYFVSTGASRIGFLDVNSRRLPIALFGAALAGVPFLPLNYRLSDAQLSELLAREPGTLVVSSQSGIDRMSGLGHHSIEHADRLLLPGGSEWDESSFVDPDDVAIVLYTSGTTSEPKAALLRHRHAVSYVLGTVEFAGAGPSDAVLVSVPPYHIAGVSTILSNIYSGRRIVYLDPFHPAEWIRTVRAHNVTHAMVVPTMLARIVEHVGEGDAQVPSLRSLAYGGARMPLPVLERALDMFPDVGFTNAYGLTETSSTIAVLGPEGHRAAVASNDPRVRARLGSAGQPVPGVEIKVVDADGIECGTGVAGSLLVRGEQVSGEYDHGSALDADGWFPTRDIASVDAEGFIFIEGRSDEMIIRGGENIAPTEVESVLLGHPAILEAAVVGLPDDEWGERVAAAVVLRPGTQAEPDELRSWVSQRLRSAKTPDVIEIRSHLSYTTTGKLLRREILKGFQNGAGAT